MKKKLILFDFDGPIVSTLELCYEIMKKANPGLTIETFMSCFNGNIINQQVINKEPDFYRYYTPALMQKTLVPDMAEVIQTLATEATLVIISATPSSAIKDFLKKHSIEKYFSGVLGRDVDHSKVVKIKMALKAFDATPQDAIMITDTAGDVYEARECGVESLAITWGYHTKELLEVGAPEFTAESPQEILKIINQKS